MRCYYKRCNHCYSKYLYYASGNVDYTYVDEDYCPDCMKVIKDALKKVEKKFDSVYIKLKDDNPLYITKEEFYKARQDRFDEIDNDKSDIKLGLKTIRVCCGRWNMETGDSETVDIEIIKNKTYKINFWKSDPDNYEIYILMEKNLKTNEIIDIWN